MLQPLSFTHSCDSIRTVPEYLIKLTFLLIYQWAKLFNQLILKCGSWHIIYCTRICRQQCTHAKRTNFSSAWPQEILQYIISYVFSTQIIPAFLFKIWPDRWKDGNWLIKVMLIIPKTLTFDWPELMEFSTLTNQRPDTSDWF